MIYYNIEGKKIEFEKDSNKFIGNGSCANIYRYDSENVIKIYNDSCSKIFRLNKNTFDEIQSIQSDNLLQISDILFQKNLKKGFKNNLFKIIYGEDALIDKYNVVAYLMKYYEQAELNILETDIDYMLQNMYKLEELFGLFTKKRILLEDVKCSNVVLGKNNIVVIDPDLFNKSTYSYHLLRAINNQQLLKLFKSIFKEHYKFLENQIPEFIEINDKLFEVSLGSSTNITKKLSKRLRKVKYPIDYFYRKSSEK